MGLEIVYNGTKKFTWCPQAIGRGWLLRLAVEGCNGDLAE